MDSVRYYRSFPDMTMQGAYTGFIYHTQTSELQLMEHEVDGIYVSDIFDSGEKATQWDELHIKLTNWSALEVFVWIFDEPKYRIRLEELSLMDRFYAISYQGIHSHHEDILLYGRKEELPRGRYLCFALQTRKKRQQILSYTGYEISYPAQHFTAYLPGFYQNQGDIEAYFSVFKDLYLFLERKIDRFHEELNPMTCDDAHVDELLDWLGFTTLKQYAQHRVLRQFPTFYRQLQAPRDSLDYICQLARFLFQRPLHFEGQDAHLTVYTSTCDTQTAMQIEAFFQNELPLQVMAQVIFVQQPQLDHTAYLNETTQLHTQAIQRMNTDYNLR